MPPPLFDPPPPSDNWWRTVPGQLTLVAMLFGLILIVCALAGIIGPRSS